MKINRFEAIGIFGSIAVMALALVLLRMDFDDGSSTVAIDPKEDEGAIVVDESTPENSERALANALLEASTARGELTRLVVDDMRVGAGDAVSTGDRVRVHYIGVTRDGVQFDSSYDRGEPFSFTVGSGNVIAGWEQGILGMRPGGQRILIIPPSLAYGDRQVGPIAANSTLVFSIELLEIVQ